MSLTVRARRAPCSIMAHQTSSVPGHPRVRHVPASSHRDTTTHVGTVDEPVVYGCGDRHHRANNNLAINNHSTVRHGADTHQQRDVRKRGKRRPGHVEPHHADRGDLRAPHGAHGKADAVSRTKQTLWWRRGRTMQLPKGNGLTPNSGTARPSSAPRNPTVCEARQGKAPPRSCTRLQRARCPTATHRHDRAKQPRGKQAQEPLALFKVLYDHSKAETC